jgi:hypothetical protein
MANYYFPQYISSKTHMIQQPSPVMLHRISGLRGAVIALLPFILITANVCATLLMALLLDTSTQLWLWIAGTICVIALSCALFIMVYRYRRKARLEIRPDLSAVTVTAPFLGVWLFPLRRMVGFESYTSETSANRRGVFVVHMLVLTLLLGSIAYIFDILVFMYAIISTIMLYPLMLRSTASSRASGMIIYFAKTDNPKAPAHEPAFMHILADDSVIQDLVKILQPLVRQ